MSPFYLPISFCFVQFRGTNFAVLTKTGVPSYISGFGRVIFSGSTTREEEKTVNHCEKRKAKEKKTTNDSRSVSWNHMDDILCLRVIPTRDDVRLQRLRPRRPSYSP